MAPHFKEMNFYKQIKLQMFNKKQTYMCGMILQSVVEINTGLEGANGLEVRRVNFLEKGGLALTFWVLFSEHPLGASVEITADGTHQKCIFLFIYFSSLENPGT